MPDILRFEPNIPVQFSRVSRQLNLLDPQPGEPIVICKRKAGLRNVWDLWLAPAAEQARASKKIAKAEGLLTWSPEGPK